MSVFSAVERAVLVRAVTTVARDVVAVDLEPANGRPLPPWTPGSHVDLLLGDGVERQYSLCGDPADRSVYRVAVLREDAGRGGSVLVHGLIPGARVRLRGPRNHFAFEPGGGGPVVLVAGGIGITPLLPMAAAAAAAGVPWQLHHAGRSRSTMAFSADLAAAHPGAVHLHPADEGERLDLVAVLDEAGRAGAAGDAPAGGQVYACGPALLLDEVTAVVAARPGWAVHLEHFEAREVGPPVWPGPFEVELALSGTTVTVPTDRSILEVVEEHDLVVVSSCRSGTCGSCETPVLEGDVEHRDSVLGDPTGPSATMMICVSRAAGPRLVLEL